jgi:hypothetical protein
VYYTCMNIFMLHTNPRLAAQAHIDRHVIKMILETAQILSTVHHIWDAPNISPSIYKPTHRNHPSVKWAAQSRAEYLWLRSLWEELHIEYQHRYGEHKKHASFVKTFDHLFYPPQKMPIPLKPGWNNCAPYMAKEFQAVGDFKQLNPVEAYREYYRKTKQTDSNGKPMAFWTNRDKPDWF